MTARKQKQIIRAGANVSLVLLQEEHAASLLALVNSNRGFLRRWLTWVDAMQNEEDFLAYIRLCKKQYRNGTDYGYLILSGDEAVGRIGMHNVSAQNQCGAIGYWLGEDFTGKGIATRACGALMVHGFATLALNRIEIRCAVENDRSAAIAERLGFQKEGRLREAEKVNGAFVDHFLYAKLRKDWLAEEPSLIQ